MRDIPEKNDSAATYSPIFSGALKKNAACQKLHGTISGEAN
jgi:hypothetical protein